MTFAELFVQSLKEEIEERGGKVLDAKWVGPELLNISIQLPQPVPFITFTFDTEPKEEP